MMPGADKVGRNGDIVRFAKDSGWCCQTNSNQSPFFADKQVSDSDQLAPFEKSGVA
jgi:hypothetical protein